MTSIVRNRRGVTLIELLIVVVLVSGIVAATYSLFQSQSQSFRKNSDRFDLAQNARGAIELTERVMRTMGAGIIGEQPALVYGNNSVVAFNADYMERDTVDMRWAAYWNPDVSVQESIAWKGADATTIPNSS
ncbi:MAG TPA: prepilin-type N-terminal cleavage/methylation domain-containing protein, partial [Gemmatimonadales bacterium]|nr:prepilin-type N-terminal cleavage/methylation domain-containing protein [Gemmatimonadales bacterium]